MQCITKQCRGQTNHVNNFIVLVAKSYMYTKHCLKEKLRKEEFEKTIENCRKFEYYQAKVNGKLNFYYKKWHGQLNQCENQQSDLAHNYLSDLLIEELRN